MKKYLRRIIAVACCTAMVFGMSTLTACGNSGDKYNVVYHLNYDTQISSRSVSVPSGGKAVNWNPRRDGHELEGWYTDEGLTHKFNFRQPLAGDVTLYAKWENVDYVSVSFDENYGGKHKNTVISSRKGKEIDEIETPTPSRLGHIFTGWYKDKECTQKWDFVSDVATSDTTLYAGYKRDNSMKLDENGKPIFENVNVNVWLGMGWDSGINDNVMWNLAKQFNADPEFSGKIKVNVTYTLSNQDTFSLRVQKTLNKNETDKNYFSIDEIYTLAGIEYSADDWYAGASRDSSVDGRLCSIPLVSGVPFIIYNKALMQKYNGDNALPESYTEFGALLKKVYDGESENDPDFKTLICNSSATWTEVSALAAFAQNGADYFEYANGGVRNTWDDNEKLTAAATALNNTYDLLGSSGKHHGLLVGDDAHENNARSRVEAGTAFMGIISWPTPIRDICDNDAYGIMPLSGLYSDGEYKDRIPVNSIGLGFYRSQNLTNTELAAAGVFADYVSRHSYAFARNGWYPVRKSVVESDEFIHSDNTKVKLLHKVGDPENFYTLDGSTKTINIATNVVANSYLKPLIQGDAQDMDALKTMAARLKASIAEA